VYNLGGWEGTATFACNAGLLELADMQDSNPCAERRLGSSPRIGTSVERLYGIDLHAVYHG
jgi:hypothetical protein